MNGHHATARWLLDHGCPLGSAAPDGSPAYQAVRARLRASLDCSDSDSDCPDSEPNK